MVMSIISKLSALLWIFFFASRLNYYLIAQTRERKYKMSGWAKDILLRLSTILMPSKGVVCVTGAGGYLGSWLVKLLLSKGYYVHGTVRNPEDPKYFHLKKLENAAENLKLFKADLLDYDSLQAAIKGCIGVFHVASPVPSSTVSDPKVDLMEPAVCGTLNVLKASTEAKVGRVVVVSSVAAVSLNPYSNAKVKDENCWSERGYLISSKNYYCLSKTKAEMEAADYSKKNGLDVVRVCPTLILGPMLQSTVNASSGVLIKLLNEGSERVENKQRDVVDVRDVAEALHLVFEKAETGTRYICASHMTNTKEMVEKMKDLYPNHNYPTLFTAKEGSDFGMISSERLQKLGWSFRSLEETLKDSVASYEEAGLLV